VALVEETNFCGIMSSVDTAARQKAINCSSDVNCGGSTHLSFWHKSIQNTTTCL